MLALLQSAPSNRTEWARWSFSNKDCLDQIRAAIREQRGVTLEEYQVDPVPWSDFSGWLNNNQQAHTDFTKQLGIDAVDLSEMDPEKPEQLHQWIWLNWMELSAACSILKIGP